MKGAAWYEADSALYVLDGPRVRIYGPDGAHRFSFGREGDGPGEFSDVGGGDFFHDRIAAAEGGVVGVRGRRFLHLFGSDGEFLRRVEQSTPPGGLFFRLNVAPYTDSSFLIAETHALDVGADRTQVDLREIRADHGAPEATDGVLGHLRNRLATVPSITGEMPNSPLLGAYDRIWDATAARLVAVVSFERHGVCFFGTDSQLVRARLVDAPIVPIDEDRKERILDESRERFGPRAPMVGEPWNEFYDYWPEALPRYTDVVLRGDSTAWLRRPIEETRFSVDPDADPPFAVDVIHARRGYLGSYESTDFPVAFKGECALFVETKVPEEAAAGAVADSAFHGLVERCPTRQAMTG